MPAAGKPEKTQAASENRLPFSKTRCEKVGHPGSVGGSMVAESLGVCHQPSKVLKQPNITVLGPPVDGDVTAVAGRDTPGA